MDGLSVWRCIIIIIVICVRTLSHGQLFLKPAVAARLQHCPFHSYVLARCCANYPTNFSLLLLFSTDVGKKFWPKTFLRRRRRRRLAVAARGPVQNETFCMALDYFGWCPTISYHHHLLYHFCYSVCCVFGWSVQFSLRKHITRHCRASREE